VEQSLRRLGNMPSRRPWFVSAADSRNLTGSYASNSAEYLITFLPLERIFFMLASLTSS